MSKNTPTPLAPGGLEPFQKSEALSLGVELELQLVNTHDYDLAPYAEDMLRLMDKIPLPGSVVPEMTSSMIEISTGVCQSSSEVLGQLTQIRDALVKCADKLNIAVVGGGTHPFQQWHERRIYDKPRFRELSELYGYLSKQFTIFGQHVHVGCPDADTALLTLHRMSRYIPHFIALSASSPYVQGQDTAFDSARLNSVFAFPLSGRAPMALTWDEFTVYFEKMTRTGVVRSMKDFYWDIRPKPEFGTIEIRVFDTPLTIGRAAALSGYVQSLASWFMNDQPFTPTEDDYLVYTYNRFQACRFGLEAVYVDPATGEHMALRDHILMTMDKIGSHARALGASSGIHLLRSSVELSNNDARWLRELQAKENLLAEVIRQAALKFRGLPV
ncbi:MULTISPECIES: YbdK family carboxylate-amine ligase [unclassified Polaromonas]|uniref:YbdK family carboxylate-amine ligase n=1 Tax=unclassified Polaromonas TaxID=2638319 RepID=UPI0025DBD446|nr:MULTISPECIES: YbdK family carboxylate-amine ligase [unclassified Polaromonas]HQS00450.1 YbdK family carboxylate-amine ligase [Polaromonas sp.]HQS41647.1 YbdK family carboxylate-amine ligase [Polaromonas sp.]HQS87033.1 YbdK family carboxylate-amine ligase [Polaromonas sp.]HQT08105.1 YbdK family carboxylate-amine ligase [Polaromonas sp.]